MVIKKPIYEILPYCYILLGFTVVMSMDSLLAYISGALLYAAGAIVWVQRSKNRRCNNNSKIANRQGRIIFPQWLYECLPFVYIAIGVAALVVIESIIGDMAGMLFMLAGSLVWLIRAIYRAHPPFEDDEVGSGSMNNESGVGKNADEKPMNA